MEKTDISLIKLGDQIDFVRHQQEQKESTLLLRHLLSVYDKKALAALLKDIGVSRIDRDKLGRWEKSQEKNPIHLNELEQVFIRKKLLPPKPKHWDKPAFTFIDLFAGIGGIRQGFEEIGGRCVFTSEWDEKARRTYLANHYVDGHELEYFLSDAPSFEQSKEANSGFMDIKRITLSDTEKAGSKAALDHIREHIPEHDTLLAGFPCQPFSLAGVSKKNSLGRSHGFECETQGTLFFDIEKIVEARQPKFIVLENVKNLVGHDSGKTFAVIVRTLDKLGYWISDVTDRATEIELSIAEVRKSGPGPIIIDAKDYLPQHRERLVLVCVRKDLSHEGFTLTKIAKPKGQQRPRLTDVLSDSVDDKYRLTPGLWGYLFKYALKHQAKGNGFGFGLVNPKDENAVTRTISARYHKDGSEILINDNGLSEDYLAEAKADPERRFDPTVRTPRRLTPRECARLMGFEKPGRLKKKQDREFQIPVSDTAAYRQFGNAVAVPVFRAVAKLMRPMILDAVEKDR